MLSVGYTIPKKNILLSTRTCTTVKTELLKSCQMLSERGFSLFATKGTHKFLTDNGMECTHLHWPDEPEEPNTQTYLKEKKIDLVINIPKNLSQSELSNDYSIRRTAVDFNIPLITDAQTCKCISICNLLKAS